VTPALPLPLAQAPAGGLEGAVAGPAGLPVAFLVGAVSFFTPCILPVLPGYLSYVSGVSGDDLVAGRGRSRVVAGTALFTAGFALVFTLLGYATVSVTRRFGGLLENLALVERVAGAVVILMGVAFLSSLWARPLERRARGPGPGAGLARAALAAARPLVRERGIHVARSSGVAGAFLLGAAFAISWTPCVGPGLATILAIAQTEGSGARGAALLAAFSLGFGVWFVLGGLAFRRATRAIAFLRRHMAALTLVGGTLLLGIGVLLVTNRWGALLAPLRRWAGRFTPPI
jgi:cytochrome c-type biogenesis protein